MSAREPEVRSARSARVPRRRTRALTRVLPALAVLLGWACASGAGAGPEPDPTTLTYAAELEVDFSRMTRTSSGLWYEDIAPGIGRTPNRGRQVWIHYIGYLPDGTVVDSSLGGEPFSFEMGSSQVIRGWNEAIMGMRVGGRRRVVIRPGLAYGVRGRGAVPPQATLVFEIQLVDAS